MGIKEILRSQIILEKGELFSETIFDEEAYEMFKKDITIKETRDKICNLIYLRTMKEVVLNKLGEYEHVHIYEEPKTFIDRLKRDLGLKYKTKDIEIKIKFRAHIVFPHAHVVFPKELGAPIFQIMDEKGEMD